MGRKPNDEKIEVVNIRMVKEPSIYSTEKIRTPDDVLRVIANELATYDREVFAVLNLKTNGQPINLQHFRLYLDTEIQLLFIIIFQYCFMCFLEFP